MAFGLLCVYIIFGSVCAAGWPYFGKKLLTRLTIYSVCILPICNFSYFTFWFCGLDLASVCFSC